MDIVKVSYPLFESQDYICADNRENLFFTMLFIFANQKGGVGKSTLALLMADFLGIHGHTCRMLDCDKQMSILNKYVLDLKRSNIPYDPAYKDIPNLQLPENPNSLFAIQRVDMGQLVAIFKEQIAQGNLCMEDEYFEFSLLDMPGGLDLNYMSPIFQVADAIIVPTCFTDFDSDSTHEFVDAVNKINSRAVKFIVPNSISSIVNYAKRPMEELYYINNGFILTPDIPKTVNLTRGLSTMEMTPFIYGMVRMTFEYILSSLKFPLNPLN